MWFLQCFNGAIQRSEGEVKSALLKVKFWQKWATVVFNERQKKVVNRLLESGPEGFEGGLTNKKYKGMTKVSRESVKRDISDLVKKGVLIKNPGGGRNVSYSLSWPKD